MKKGGKETISYGVSAQSGQIIYECSMRGCINSTDIDADSVENANDLPNDTAPKIDPTASAPSVEDEVIIVRRQTQTVRAIEPRTGQERWNFSVGKQSLSKERKESFIVKHFLNFQ